MYIIPNSNEKPFPMSVASNLPSMLRSFSWLWLVIILLAIALVSKAPPEEEFGDDDQSCHTMDDGDLSINQHQPFELGVDLGPQDSASKQRRAEGIELVGEPAHQHSKR